MAGIMVQARLATPTIIEEVVKNRRIQMKEIPQQGLGIQQRTSPRVDRQNTRDQWNHSQRSSPRMDNQEYSVEISNRYSALEQENY